MAAIEERRAALGEKTGGSDENLYNSRHTGEQIDGAVTSVLDNGTVWSGKAEKGEAVSLILRKDGWDETRMTQTLTGSILRPAALTAISWAVPRGASKRTISRLRDRLRSDARRSRKGT